MFFRFMVILGVLLLLAGLAWAAPAEPLVTVEYREDLQSREQNRELTRVLEISLRVRLEPTSNPDSWKVTGIEAEEIHGRQIFSKTSGSEVYVLEKVIPAQTVGRVTLWRDEASKKVLAVSLPPIRVDLIWQSPEGPEPPESLMVEPVTQDSGEFKDGKVPDPDERPALPDGAELPQWLKKKGVHPDFMVETCETEGNYAGGGAWLKEEPDSIIEKTYLWEFELRR